MSENLNENGQHLYAHIGALAIMRDSIDGYQSWIDGYKTGRPFPVSNDDLDKALARVIEAAQFAQRKISPKAKAEGSN